MSGNQLGILKYLGRTAESYDHLVTWRHDGTRGIQELARVVYDVVGVECRIEMEEQTEKTRHRFQEDSSLRSEVHVSLTVTVGFSSAHPKAKTASDKLFMHFKFVESYSKISVDKSESVSI